MEEKKINTEGKVKKEKGMGGTIAINVIMVVVLLIAAVFIFEAFYVNKNMYNNFFGYAILPVESNSMKGSEKDSFNKGDLIFCKILKTDKQKEVLKVNDIITFRTVLDVNGKAVDALNTHRIVSIDTGVGKTTYVTRGDASEDPSNVERPSIDDVVAVYTGKIPGIGHVGLFAQTGPGMFVLLVLPTLIVLGFAVFFFIRNMRSYNKEKSAVVMETKLTDEREKIRLELLKELQNQHNISIDDMMVQGGGTQIDAKPVEKPVEPVIMQEPVAPVIVETEALPEEVKPLQEVKLEEPAAESKAEEMVSEEKPKAQTAAKPKAAPKPKTEGAKPKTEGSKPAAKPAAKPAGSGAGSATKPPQKKPAAKSPSKKSEEKKD